MKPRNVRLRIGRGILTGVGVENESGGKWPLEPKREGIKRAIVLSGGGARGAYEAGVLRYVFGRLPERLGYVPRVDLYCGSSVGAVHACFLAAYADGLPDAVGELSRIWDRMSFDRVYRFGLADAASFTRALVGLSLGRPREIDDHPTRIHGLLNTAPLEELVVTRIPWRRLRRNIRSGLVDALCVGATEIAGGRTVVFVDQREHQPPPWTHDRFMVARPARLGPVHALASAAIPFLFPAVRIQDSYFCDGGLRQSTPLTSALRLGANRVLVVGLRKERPEARTGPEGEERLRQFVSAGFLFGKVLNAVLTDRIEFDLSHMRVLNEVLRAGIEIDGEAHLERVNARVERQRGLGFRVVEDAFIRPSEDIGRIAARHVHRVRKGLLGVGLRDLAFRLLARNSPEEEADLMSYLLFDGLYAAELMDLGESDAEAQAETLVSLFSG